MSGRRNPAYPAPMREAIITDWEATRDTAPVIAARIGCDPDYAANVLNIHRASVDLRPVHYIRTNSDAAYIAACIVQGGFPAYRLPPTYRVPA